jgi:hypothetical protein
VTSLVSLGATNQVKGLTVAVQAAHQGQARGDAVTCRRSDQPLQGTERQPRRLLKASSIVWPWLATYQSSLFLMYGGGHVLSGAHASQCDTLEAVPPSCHARERMPTTRCIGGSCAAHPEMAQAAQNVVGWHESRPVAFPVAFIPITCDGRIGARSRPGSPPQLSTRLSNSRTPLRRTPRYRAALSSMHAKARLGAAAITACLRR